MEVARALSLGALMKRGVLPVQRPRPSEGIRVHLIKSTLMTQVRTFCGVVYVNDDENPRLSHFYAECTCTNCAKAYRRLAREATP